jgi:hypothetical protein
MSIVPALALSPAFERARTLSRIMTVIFTIAFCVMAAALVAAPVMVVFPSLHGGIGLPHGIRIPIGALRGGPAIGAMAAAMLMLLPITLTLHHARRLFACFAKGEVFAARPIAHIRAAGLWLTVSFFTDIAGIMLLRYCGIENRIGASLPAMAPRHSLIAPEFLGVLFTGIATIIAAYVMGEARRIADENASIL